MKVARTVWSGGKLGDEFKELPIAIGACEPVPYRQSSIGRAGTKDNERSIEVSRLEICVWWK